ARARNPKKSVGHLLARGRRQDKFELVGQMAKQYPVDATCDALEASRSGYYAHQRKPQRPRRQADQALKDKIRESHRKSRRTYGTPRIREDLARQGVRCGRKRIGRLMREQGLKAICKRRSRKPRTT